METKITANVSQLKDNERKTYRGKFDRALVAIDKTTGAKVLEVQIKYTNTTCNAYAWLKSGANYLHGVGSSGKYSFCPETAFASCLKSLGIELYRDGKLYSLGKIGLHDIEEALQAVCTALNYSVLVVDIRDFQ